MEEYFKAVKVTENVYWVGAIDWSIRNFHGYETGRGSTYNAFLVLDEKITLIDSVKGPFVGELLARIRSVIGDVTKIDYIVSNHAERTTPAGCPATIEAIKPEKVFASPVGQKTLTAYYAISALPRSRPVRRSASARETSRSSKRRCCTGRTAW